LDNEAVSNLNKERHTSVLGVCATPAVWNGRVYFVGAAGLNCVSAKDGTLLWQVKHKPEQASPLVADGIVYHCGCAYNAETGQVLWKTPRDNGGCYGPTLGVFGGRKYIFAAGSGAVHCLDLQTGKENWTTKYTSTWTMEGATSGDVLIGDGKMYKMTPSGIQLDKTLVDFKGMSFGLSWIIHQDHLYRYVFAAEGNPKNSKIDGLCCFDLKSGDLKWAYRGPTCTWDTDYTPSILADGKIIGSFGSGANFMWENDGVAMYQATPEKYTLLGSFKPGLIPWTPMAFGGGRLLVRTEAGISCYDLR
jgi:outer membrane protein assembly factor BamB